MTLNHLNLTVTNALEAADFLEKYFGLQAHHKSEAFSMLRDEAGMILTLFRVKRGTEFSYPETFHIGFAQDSEEKVNEINQQLKDAGFDVPAPARLHGSWTFYFTAPGGYTIEVLG